eukprot:GHVL01020103.1.p1 GENE.GHVL01020103.1~~GHVL01020103.1.p1  ORF type:complete len:454 (+),score=109.78 GHVL01020103.1:332-1693(+)
MSNKKRSRSKTSCEDILSIRTKSPKRENIKILSILKNIKNFAEYKIYHTPIYYNKNNFVNKNIDEYIDNVNKNIDESIDNYIYKYNINDKVIIWEDHDSSNWTVNKNGVVMARCRRSVGDKIFGGWLKEYFVKIEDFGEWFEEGLLMEINEENKKILKKVESILTLIDKEWSNSKKKEKIQNLQILNQYFHPTTVCSPKNHFVWRTPPNVVGILYEDKKTSQNNKIYILPHIYPIETVFDEFEKNIQIAGYKITDETSDRHCMRDRWLPNDTSITQDIFLDYSNFNKKYWKNCRRLLTLWFDFALPRWLLSPVERPQWDQIKAKLKDDSLAPSQIYGIEHLFRLIQILPSMIFSVSSHKMLLLSYLHLAVDFFYRWCCRRARHFQSDRIIYPDISYFYDISEYYKCARHRENQNVITDVCMEKYIDNDETNDKKQLIERRISTRSMNRTESLN